MVIDTEERNKWFINTYRGVIPKNLYDIAEDFMLGINKGYTITKEELDNLKILLEKRNAFFALIDNTAILNNKGIQYEKEGNFIEAIKCYEQNILTRYTATHSYSRLIILYKKNNDFLNELRVLNIAIEVFSEKYPSTDPILIKWIKRRNKIIEKNK